MNTWDFLIQREDEQDWSFLDSLTQFKAGKYRLIACTSKVNQPIDIRITYSSKSDLKDLTTRQNQHYFGRTDAEGLLSILPSMELTPGNWEISCRPDIMGELRGENWQQRITLEVCSNIEIQQQQSLEDITEEILVKSSFKDEENQLATLELNSIELELDYNNYPSDIIGLIQTESEGLQKADFRDIPESIKGEALSESEIVANSDEISLVPIKFRSTKYVIQLTYLDYDSSIIFDIEIIESEQPSPKILDLPDPKKMNRPLYKTYLSHQKTLPPKLYPHRSSNKGKRSIQLAKFQPCAISA